MSWGYDWAPRQTAAERRAAGERLIAAAARRGTPMAPVRGGARTIAHTFWGKAWCDNLARYRDYANRLDRGRSYVRSGAVIDLAIRAGHVDAQVLGSALYTVEIEIAQVHPTAWTAIQADCAGSIASRVDLLSGRLTEPVMARLCAVRTGLFPAANEIFFTCTCPDAASMCKHVAAVMYGIGARLDQAPELLFTLRRVSADDLIAHAVSALPAAPARRRLLATEGLGALFGLDLVDAPAPKRARAKAPPRKRRSR